MSCVCVCVCVSLCLCFRLRVHVACVYLCLPSYAARCGSCRVLLQHTLRDIVAVAPRVPLSALCVPPPPPRPCRLVRAPAALVDQFSITSAAGCRAVPCRPLACTPFFIFLFVFATQRRHRGCPFRGAPVPSPACRPNLVWVMCACYLLACVLCAVFVWWCCPPLPRRLPLSRMWRVALACFLCVRVGRVSRSRWEF